MTAGHEAFQRSFCREQGHHTVPSHLSLRERRSAWRTSEFAARRLDAVWRGILRSRGDIPSHITEAAATPSAVVVGTVSAVRCAGGRVLGGGRDGADGARAGPDRAADAGGPPSTARPRSKGSESGIVCSPPSRLQIMCAPRCCSCHAAKPRSTSSMRPMRRPIHVSRSSGCSPRTPTRRSSIRRLLPRTARTRARRGCSIFSARRPRSRSWTKRASPSSRRAEAHGRFHSPICSSAPRRRAL